MSIDEGSGVWKEMKRRETGKIPFHKYCGFCQDTCIYLQPTKSEYLLVTNVWNEEARIADAFKSVSMQDKKPKLWIWMEDGSTDNTYLRIKEENKKHPDIKITIERMPTKRKANFFTLGKTHEAIIGNMKARIDELKVDYFAILDVDSEPCPGYFSRLINLLDNHGELGAVSGYPIGEWKKRRVSQPMNSGKLIRWPIVRNIQKYWDFCPDTFYNIKALAEKYRLKVFHIPIFQNRPSSNFQKSGAFRMGRVAYYGGRPFLGVLLRAIRRSVLRLHGTSMLQGYFMEYARGTWHCQDADVRRYFGAGMNVAKVLLELLKLYEGKETGLVD